MNCPKCNQLVDPGAAFCGNCGNPISDRPNEESPIDQILSGHHAKTSAHDTKLLPAAASAPAYAIPEPAQQQGETKALLSLLLGVIGIAGCYYMALLGLVFGVAGIILGTMSRQSIKKGLSTAGLVTSSLALLAGLGVWAYFITHDPRLQQGQATGKSVQHNVPTNFVAATSLSTPCYYVGFTSKLNVSNLSGSCDMNAFNGGTMDNSSELYKVYASKANISEDGFADTAKSAIESDVHTNLPGFDIKSEKAGQFAGSTAYFVDAKNAKAATDVYEAAVYHQTQQGDNLFVIVHAVAGGDSANLNSLEAQWQWK